MASILVTKGINAGDYYPLGTGSFTAGRDAKNTAQLLDDRISRTHIRVRYDHDLKAYFVSDSESSNGSMLNGKKLTSAEAALSDGDEIHLGESTLRFSVQDFPNRESAQKYFRELRWFGEDGKQTLI